MVNQFQSFSPQVNSGWARMRQRIEGPVARRPSWIARNAADFWQLIKRPAVPPSRRRKSGCSRLRRQSPRRLEQRAGLRRARRQGPAGSVRRTSSFFSVRRRPKRACAMRSARAALRWSAVRRTRTLTCLASWSAAGDERWRNESQFRSHHRRANRWSDRMIRRLSVLGVLVLCMAMLAATPAFAWNSAQTSVASADRQILVMVKHPPDHFRPNGAYGGSYGDDLARSARRRLAADRPRLRPEAGRRLADADGRPRLLRHGGHRRAPTKAVERCSRDSAVAWSQPVSSTNPVGPAVAQRPALSGPARGEQWRLAELHELATGRGVRVAVIDSGISSASRSRRTGGSQPQLRRRPAGQSANCTAPESPGSSPPGPITDRHRRSRSGARILGLRACWQSGRSPEPDRLRQLQPGEGALFRDRGEGSEVINLSLSGPDDRLIHELIDLVSIAGSASSRQSTRTPERRLPGLRARRHRCLKRHLGSRARAGLHCAGRDVPTTEPGGRWFLVNGSSYSAAHVSGLMALIRQRQHIGGHVNRARSGWHH